MTGSPDFDTKVTHSVEFCSPRPSIYLSVALLGNLFAFWNLIASSSLGGNSKYFLFLVISLFCSILGLIPEIMTKMMVEEGTYLHTFGLCNNISATMCQDHGQSQEQLAEE